jgi:putative peptidoglycan lipid II flippase
VIAVSVNIALKVALMGPLQQIGLALATALSAWINFILLVWTLHRRGQLALDARLKRTLLPLAGATAGMAVVLRLALPLLEPWLHGPAPVARVVALGGLIALGLVVFAGLALVSGAVDRAQLRRLLRRGRT